MPHRYWAFFADPSHYRIEEAARTLETDWWTTKGRPIRMGDRVVIWMAKGRGDRRGVVALGEVVTEPEPRPDSENPYLVTAPPPDRVEERVGVRYLHPPGLPLWEPHPALASLSVSRARGGTVFRVSPEQWGELLDLVGGWPGGQEDVGDPHGSGIGPPELIPHQRYRRVALHRHFGGQSQGGISTPAGHPLILLFSTPGGGDYGYRDGWTEDGLYGYTGEGQVGDMAFVRGNAAIRDHAEDGKDLLLFEGAGGGVVEFSGRMVSVGHRWGEGPDRDGNARRVIIFQLAPAERFGEGGGPAAPVAEEMFGTLAGLDPAELRVRALGGPSSGDGRVTPAERVRRVWVRSQAVRLYALWRAGGVCEGCGVPAPFATPDGRPFLEVHHLRRLSDGGPDRPEAVAAVCPNCHRRAHHAADAWAFNREVERRVRARETELGYPLT